MLSEEQALEAHAKQISAVVTGIALAVLAWSGLLWVMLNQYPTVPTRWTFYALLHIALTGTALPFVHFLNRRFARRGGLLVPISTLLRQSMWIGLLGTLCIWLRIPRLLSIPIVVVLALAMIIIEALLRLREVMAWRPE